MAGRWVTAAEAMLQAMRSSCLITAPRACMYAAFQGRAAVEFDAVRESRTWRGVLDLQGPGRGRLALEARWTPLLAQGG